MLHEVHEQMDLDSSGRLNLEALEEGTECTLRVMGARCVWWGHAAYVGGMLDTGCSCVATTLHPEH